MQVNFIDQYDGFKFEEYQKEFDSLLKKTQELLSLNDEYCLSVISLNDEEIHQINYEYRKIDRPTDVITFAIKDDYDDYGVEELENELGDIFINIDATRRQAIEYNHSFRRELCFLFVHGLLHLLGYDHMNPEDEKEMFDLQHKIIDDLIPFEDKD